MTKKFSFDSELSSVCAQFMSEVVNPREDGIDDEDARDMLENYVINNLDQEYLKSVMFRALIASKWNGLKRSRTRPVPRGEQGELFDDLFFEHGMMTPEGYISNGSATYEHRLMALDKAEATLKKAKDQVDTERDRNTFLQRGFDAGAATVRDALSYLDATECEAVKTLHRSISASRTD